MEQLYTISELAAKWETTENDILMRAFSGKIQLSAVMTGYLVPGIHSLEFAKSKVKALKSARIASEEILEKTKESFDAEVESFNNRETFMINIPRNKVLSFMNQKNVTIEHCSCCGDENEKGYTTLGLGWTRHARINRDSLVMMTQEGLKNIPGPNTLVLTTRRPDPIMGANNDEQEEIEAASTVAIGWRKVKNGKITNRRDGLLYIEDATGMSQGKARKYAKMIDKKFLDDRMQKTKGGQEAIHLTQWDVNQIIAMEKSYKNS